MVSDFPHSIFLIWIPSNDQWQANYLIDLKNEVIFYDALSGESNKPRKERVISNDKTLSIVCCDKQLKLRYPIIKYIKENR